MTFIIGILGGLLLAACGIPQAVKTLKDGHAKGLSLNFMLMLIGGIFLMGLYIFLQHGWDWVIHGEYAISISVWAISLYYYFFPRLTMQDHVIKTLDKMNAMSDAELKAEFDKYCKENP